METLSEFRKSYPNVRFGFYKEKPSDRMWGFDCPDLKFGFMFSFDKEHIYSFFADYPHNMTDEEVEIFKKEQPYWANFGGRGD